MKTHLHHLSASNRTRKSPYYEATMAAGVKGFTVYNHMLLPTYYEDPVADYWPLIKGVSMWDVAVERQVELRGPDALALLTMMTPRDLTALTIGQCKYVPLVDHRGRMVNDPVLLRLGFDHFWLSVADSDVLLWAKGLAYGLGLDVTIVEPDVSPMAVQGPVAEDVVAALLGEWIRDIRFFRFQEFDFDGIPLIVARSGWSKQGGFELYLRDGSRGTDLWERVAAAGRPFGIQPGTPSSIERVEVGLLSYGNDMTLEHNPFEVGLGKYCAVDQEADFIGKEALQEVVARGVTRSSTGLVIDGDPISTNENWWPVVDADGQRLGEVTSAAHSPRTGQNIGLTMLAASHQTPGTVVTVQLNESIRQATVAQLPFV